MRGNTANVLENGDDARLPEPWRGIRRCAGAALRICLRYTRASLKKSPSLGEKQAELRSYSRYPVGQQEAHEYEALRGDSGRRLYCRLTSFSQSLQTNLRMALDGTKATPRK